MGLKRVLCRNTYKYNFKALNQKKRSVSKNKIHSVLILSQKHSVLKKCFKVRNTKNHSVLKYFGV